MSAFACPCGEVRIELGDPPDFLHQCNCSLCAPLDAWWGYFDPSQVRLSGRATLSTRNDRPHPKVAIYVCEGCGAATHFRTLGDAGNPVIGVNCKLARRRELKGLALRFPDGRGWSGDGPFAYVSDPVIL